MDHLARSAFASPAIKADILAQIDAWAAARVERWNGGSVIGDNGRDTGPLPSRGLLDWCLSRPRGRRARRRLG
jgi:hypothetical protein